MNAQTLKLYSLLGVDDAVAVLDAMDPDVLAEAMTRLNRRGRGVPNDPFAREMEGKTPDELKALALSLLDDDESTPYLPPAPPSANAPNAAR